jgi:hypothetical protein
MAHFDEALDMPQFGARVELRRTGAQTDGELLEVDVIGRPRGIVTQ